MNHVHFLGRLTKDLEPRTNQSGKSVLNNSIAINRPFKNQDGEREADFINFVAFGKTAEIITQYHKKGDMIGLSGRMQSRTYQNKDDKTVFVTEMVVNEMHFAGSNNNSQGQSQQQGAKTLRLNKTMIPIRKPMAARRRAGILNRSRMKIIHSQGRMARLISMMMIYHFKEGVNFG